MIHSKYKAIRSSIWFPYGIHVNDMQILSTKYLAGYITDKKNDNSIVAYIPYKFPLNQYEFFTHTICNNIRSTI